MTYPAHCAKINPDQKLGFHPAGEEAGKGV